MKISLRDALRRGIAAHKEGQLEAAERIYRAILDAEPSHSDANHNMGVLVARAGKPREAFPFFEMAVKVNPNVAQYWISYIDALVTSREYKRASTVLRRSKKKKFKNAYFSDLETKIETALKNIEAQDPPQDVLNKVLSSLNSKPASKTQEIIENKLIQFPNSASLLTIQGILLSRFGDNLAAIERFKRAISIDPENVHPLHNLGMIHHQSGNLAVALGCFKRAIELDANFLEAKYGFAETLKLVRFNEASPGMLPVIEDIIDRRTLVRPSDILMSVISLLKHENEVKLCFKWQGTSKDQRSLSSVIDHFMKVPVLLKLMSVCPIGDIQLERFFSSLRAHILLEIDHINGSSALLAVMSALSLQCFTNEYIYPMDDMELRSLEALEFKVARKLKAQHQPEPKDVLCLATYKPLYEYEWAELLEVNDDILDVYLRQYSQPLEECSLGQNIPCLAEIEDKTSELVREQYENYPYPRWHNTYIPNRSATIEEIAKNNKLQIINQSVFKVAEPSILIAGCGTGQHAVYTASRFKSSQLLAVDLSLASLSYALRKTKEFDINNINFTQGDILDLEKLNRQFDIIESVGVLHHMKDPIEGWKTLVNCLKNGGLMRVGLYSSSARAHISKLRSKIEQTHSSDEKRAIRLFRENVLHSDEPLHVKLRSAPDFYSLSELKDLIFHVQEHTFTIPELEGIINKLGLSFCGFESRKIQQDFLNENKNASDRYNLTKWHEFEISNPDTFSSMYQFWCQKI